MHKPTGLYASYMIIFQNLFTHTKLDFFNVINYLVILIIKLFIIKFLKSFVKQLTLLVLIKIKKLILKSVEWKGTYLIIFSSFDVTQLD